MLILLSPAKKQIEHPLAQAPKSTPTFLDQAETLMRELQQRNAAQLGSLLSISDSLATLNESRNQNWTKDAHHQHGVAAVSLFQGDVYQGLQVDTLEPSAYQRLQDTVFILSGLYGLLRPFDHILPHRLEMGAALANQRGKDLYAFWRTLLTDTLNTHIREHQHACVINLASNEYAKAIDWKRIDCDVINPRFLDAKSGQYKMISFFAKKARGMMARHLVQTDASTTDALASFTIGGYRFSHQRSQAHEPVFLRDVA